MSKKKVSVQIVTKSVTDEHNDEIVSNFSGTHYINGDSTYLTYTENHDDENILVTLKIQDKKIKISRFGNYPSTMTIDETTDTFCHYPTIAGTLPLTIKHSKIENLLIDNGDINLSYSLFNENSLICKNNLILTVKEV